MKRRILPTLSLILLLSLLAATVSMGATPPLLPFDRTGDLFVLDDLRDGEGRILRITPEGDVFVEVTNANIMAETGETAVRFDDNGIAFDAQGNMYFTEGVSDAILKREPDGTLMVLTSQTVITTETGIDEAQPEGIAFSDDGFLYVNDDSSDSVLQVDPSTGAVLVYVAESTLEALTGITSVDLNSPIVGAEGGVVYTASDGDPDAIFEIAPGGTPSVLASGSPFSDLDVFMTRHPNGDLIIADNSGADTIHRVTPGGTVDEFLSESALEGAACVGEEVDLEGGIAFDDAGNFFIAEENTDAIYKFDPDLNCWLFVAEADVPGFNADYKGGIAFAPRSAPVGGVTRPSNLLSTALPVAALVGLAGVALGLMLVTRRQRA